MSKFFQALERAERERLRRRDGELRDAAGDRAPILPEMARRRVEPDGLERPCDVATEPPKEAANALDGHLVSLLAPASFEAEQYRVLRHLVEQLRKSAGLSVVAVSSPGVADGKTTTAINLAGALAQAPDARVLLVDADIRMATVATRLGLGERASPGFVDAILDSNLTLASVVRARPQHNLAVLPSGKLASAPYEVLKSARTGELLEEARGRYDYVVLDTPPLVSVPDCRVIGKLVDGFLLVVTAHKTPRKLVEEALSIVEPAKLVGLVFNGDDRHLLRSTYSYYASYYPASQSLHRNGNGWRHRIIRSLGTRRRRTASDD